MCSYVLNNGSHLSNQTSHWGVGTRTSERLSTWLHKRVPFIPSTKASILPDLFFTYSLLVISMETHQCFHAETSQVHSDLICVFWECRGDAGVTDNTFILPDLFFTYSLLVISMEIYQSFHAETCQVHSTRYVCSENAEGMPKPLTKHLYCLSSF